MHPVPNDEAMLPMIDGLIDGLISGPLDGISKQCNNAHLYRYIFAVALDTRQTFAEQSRAWINGTASPDSPLKTAWRRMGRTWVEGLAPKSWQVRCSSSIRNRVNVLSLTYAKLLRGGDHNISSQFLVLVLQRRYQFSTHQACQVLSKVRYHATRKPLR
ncbi:hypothetical protein PspLS_01241 [Pyricularia sp. CBS 133598]|nr:hypothetical protein PspLS_01241 [Pyricularia sp. CBS 133598]